MSFRDDQSIADLSKALAAMSDLLTKMSIAEDASSSGIEDLKRKLHNSGIDVKIARERSAELDEQIEGLESRLAKIVLHTQGKTFGKPSRSRIIKLARGTNE